MTTTTTLPGHEKCTYEGISTPKLNEAWGAIGRWITRAEDRIIACEPELNRMVAEQGVSEEVRAYAAFVLSVINDVENVAETRNCLMNEIQNRAYAENDNR